MWDAGEPTENMPGKLGALTFLPGPGGKLMRGSWAEIVALGSGWSRQTGNWETAAQGAESQFGSSKMRETGAR